MSAIDLQTSYALDDSCQMQFFAKGHHAWGSFIEAMRAELAADNRDDIPWWVVVQAPIKQVYRRTVPCRNSIVSDIQYVDQDKPGRGATPITVMEFWFPLHRPAEDYREREKLEQAKADAERLIESMAQAIYDQWAFTPHYVEWVPGGNSDRQHDARHIARAAIARVQGEKG